MVGKNQQDLVQGQKNQYDYDQCHCMNQVHLQQNARKKEEGGEKVMSTEHRNTHIQHDSAALIK